MGLVRKVTLVGLPIFVLTLLGLPARATYGARTSADEPQYLLTALSIAQDWDLDIANQRYSGAYREFHEALLPVQTLLRPDGSRVSPHSPLLPLYLALPMRLGGWVGAKTALAALAGTLGALLVWVGVTRLGIRFEVAAPVVALMCLSPPLAWYATQVYPEVAAALLVTMVIASLTGPPGRAAAMLVAIGVIALPWLAVKYIPVAAILALAGAWKFRGRPSLLAFLGLALAGAGAIFLWFNQTIYRGWTPYASGDFFVDGELIALGPAPDYPARSQRLLGLWVDRGFGLAAWQPAYLLAVPAAAWAIRQRSRTAYLLLGMAATGWLVATYLAQTMHGWWWPGRQVTVILPALILLLMIWISGTPQARIPFLAIAGTGVVAFVFLAIEATAGHLALIVDFTSTANPLYGFWKFVLPDYQAVSSSAWTLHGAWLATFAVLAVGGWRWSPAARPVSPTRY